MSEPTIPHHAAVARLRPVSRTRAPREWRVTSSDQPVSAAIAALTRRLQRAAFTNVGFPGSTDFDFSELTHLLGHQLLNNCGDPFVDGVYPWHTKHLEREVITIIGDLLRAPADDRWGYGTLGGSESNLAAMHRARERYPDAVVYLSASAHYSVRRCASILRMPTGVIDSDDIGEMDYQDLAGQLVRNRHLPAVIIATIGTTMTEAVDDIRRITAIADAVGVRQRWIHADAALAGLPLALLDPGDRPGIDFTDATITGSRSGHTALMICYSLRKQGIDGLRRRAEAARRLAAHTQARLDAIGWTSFRNPHAFTVVLKTPPPDVADKWILASEAGWSHVVCMPGVTIEQIEALIADLENALGHGTRATVRTLAPRQDGHPAGTSDAATT